MKLKLGFAVMALGMWTVMLGCDPTPIICTRLCDRLYFAEEDYAARTCDGLKGSKNDTKEPCRDSCHAAWDNTSSADKDVADACLNCIMDEIPSKPNYDEVDDAMAGPCRYNCKEQADIQYAWDSFYTDWHAKLSYGDPNCPPKYPPPVEPDAGTPDAGVK